MKPPSSVVRETKNIALQHYKRSIGHGSVFFFLRPNHRHSHLKRFAFKNIRFHAPSYESRKKKLNKN